MSRISSKFKELQKKGEKALVTFITAGDPSLAATEKLMDALEKSGADLIELGIPFSDPMADGPVIQKSSERALKSKTTLKTVLSFVKKIRKNTNIPIVLMGYYNPILQYGCERFCKESFEAGVDGLIVVDLPPEESLELRQYTAQNNIDLIYLLTPTTDAKRISKIKQLASGFIYYVSMTGVTGGKVSPINSIAKQLKLIKSFLSLPVCVGFGIHSPQEAKEFSRHSEGVVVGSALVSLLENGVKADTISRLSKMVSGFKKALK